jgi:hypothetical protein
MPASSRRTPTDKKAARAKKGFRRKPQAGLFKSIWLGLTTLLSERRPKSRPSSSRRPIRRPAGPGAHGGQAFFAYSTNYLIDVDNPIIVDVEATTVRQAEVLAAKRMIERSMERFDLYPARLMGDSAYGSAEMLGWLVHEHGIEPHVTVFDKSACQDGTFSRDDFTYDHVRDLYLCPGGKKLTTTGTLVNDNAMML